MEADTPQPSAVQVIPPTRAQEIPRTFPSTLTSIQQRFVDLSEDDLKEVDAVLREPRDNTLLIEKFNIRMTKYTVSCLRLEGLLNDDVIYFYFLMLKERNDYRADRTGTKKSWYFPTFFIGELLKDEKYCFENVKKYVLLLDFTLYLFILSTTSLGGRNPSMCSTWKRYFS